MHDRPFLIHGEIEFLNKEKREGERVSEWVKKKKKERDSVTLTFELYWPQNMRLLDVAEINFCGKFGGPGELSCAPPPHNEWYANRPIHAATCVDRRV